MTSADAAAAADGLSSSEEDDSSEEEEQEEEEQQQAEVEDVDVDVPAVASIQQRLDSCTATVYPPLNPDHESLTWPHSLVQQYQLEARASHDGVTFTGVDTVLHYEQARRPTHSLSKRDR